MSENLYGSKVRQREPARVYSNRGNIPLLDMLGNGCKRILDIGCGAGDNAELIKSRYPECEVFGITYSAAEAELASTKMKECLVFDIEADLPSELATQSFDTLFLSHVLEHLKDPDAVIEKFSRLLGNGGQVLIAVPNILSWRMRLQFLRGNFEYTSDGELDDTHLRFFTFFTADKFLLSKSHDLVVTDKRVSGSVPLWFLRRYLFPNSWAECIDNLGCRYWPNLFGSQVMIRAVKT